MRSAGPDLSAPGPVPPRPKKKTGIKQKIMKRVRFMADVDDIHQTEPPYRDMAPHR